MNKENAKNNRNHYYLFSVEPIENNKLIRKYVYLKTVCSTN
ncbi:MULTISPECIES: DUF5960 family protein [Streptococcus]|nr:MULTISPECIES: DUF5960 family protein [unclassified Streptococcus]